MIKRLPHGEFVEVHAPPADDTSAGTAILRTPIPRAAVPRTAGAAPDGIPADVVTDTLITRTAEPPTVSDSCGVPPLASTVTLPVKLTVKSKSCPAT